MPNRYLLSEMADYAESRVNIKSVSLDDYVSTDNLLPNKHGLALAVNLPSQQGKIPSYQKADILIGNIRPYLKKIWFADRVGGCSADVLVIRTKEHHNPKFVFYGLFRDDFFNHMMRGSKGTKMPRGDKPQIMRFALPKFDKGTQHEIASVLSALDAKIGINNRINTELEAIANTLYDYWFIQFDFPNENGKPYKSSGGKMEYNPILKREIPNGWSEDSLEALGDIVGGSTPSTADSKNFMSNGIPWITPNDLSDNVGKKFISRGNIDISEQGMKSASLKLYPKNTVLMSSRAPIGYMAIARNPVTTNQGFKSFIPNKGYSAEFIFYTVKSVMKTIVKYSGGSTFKEVSASALKTVKIVLPPSNILKSYTEIIVNIFNQQDILEQENQKLVELRDWLLPMLMNDQVRIASGINTTTAENEKTARWRNG